MGRVRDDAGLCVLCLGHRADRWTGVDCRGEAEVFDGDGAGVVFRCEAVAGRSKPRVVGVCESSVEQTRYCDVCRQALGEGCW